MSITRLETNAIGTTIPVTKGGTGVTTSADLANTGNLVLLSSQTASNDASIAFNNTLITDTHDTYLLTFRDVDTANDGVSLQLVVSNDNGSSYHTGSSYKRVTGFGNHGHSNDSSMDKKTQAANNIVLAGAGLDLGSVDKETAAGHMWMYNLRKSDRGKCFFLSSTYEGTTEKGALNFGSVYLDLDLVVNNIRVDASNGNLSDGTFSLYGLRE